MARGRMISNSLGRSRKFARLANDTHRLAYILLVTHADVEGRVEAHPRILNGLAYTMLGWTDKQVVDALDDMHDAGLIELYEVDDEAYAQVVDFEKHNKVRRDREGESSLPPPPNRAGSTPGVRPESARQAPAQVQVEVQVEREVEEEPSTALGEVADEMKALTQLRRKDREAFRTVEVMGGQLRWQFRHKNLAAAEVLRRGQPALDALAETLKGASKTGAPAYRYFEVILEGRGAKKAQQGERDYAEVSAGDLLDHADANLAGRWS